MRFAISTKELLFNVRSIARQELTAAIADDTLRYRAEPGTEKQEVLDRFVLESFEEVSELLGRFALPIMYDEEPTVDYRNVPLPEYLNVVIDATPRRMQGKSATIEAKFTSAMTQMVLAKHYFNVAQGELAQIHERLVNDEVTALRRLIYIKRPPIFNIENHEDSTY